MCDKPELDKPLTKENLLQMYSLMFKARRFEETVSLLFTSGELPGTVHLYTGQEAVAVGVCSALRQDDWITSTHRPHGHAVAKDIPIKTLMAELFGRTTGCCKGYGGSMHLGDINYGMLPAIAIVGGAIPIATGIALAFKMQKTRRVVACFFGDGAVNEGAFHEGVNMAAIWNLPVVFICENNLYGASTHISRVTKTENVADRAIAYGIPSVITDGMNVIDVYNAASKAIERARTGKGPTLIECKTYRYVGHSRSDPQLYRPKEEVEAWKQKDPIMQLKEFLTSRKIATASEIKQLEKLIEEEIENAVNFARSSPHPIPKDALLNVFK
jgi:pyruvate dehydrogenase E1 component alpha subunit